MNSEAKYPIPPAHVQRFVDVLGVETTIDFLLNFGGAELSIPTTPKGKSEVERVIGFEKMQRLSGLSYALKHRIPLGTKWLAQCLSVQGLSTAAIARRLRVTDVTVRKYLHGRNEPKGAKPW
ncbi:helix-turn-helix domain-containing protein [Sulfitobacter sp. F26204]|uniref:helix-turn-helix domain-containing protein n=1 Tax=Sulfitobacter sp. F26204 TaxID=2996014 RepID=UPI00225E28C8|nr:helix-turn-helix domain-containing protein [Sulfitobacter sp. F26204]MCX7559110.1 helix-turn-helix domain-containing protein [Sulfitobacter sp. F26204]